SKKEETKTDFNKAKDVVSKTPLSKPEEKQPNASKQKEKASTNTFAPTDKNNGALPNKTPKDKISSFIFAYNKEELKNEDNSKSNNKQQLKQEADEELKKQDNSKLSNNQKQQPKQNFDEEMIQ
ncbi:MAG: hypothetical protein ACI4TT_03235, partial [Christensenellales bacterium]